MADANRYNLEVFLTIARRYRQNLEMLITLDGIAAAPTREKALESMRAINSTPAGRVEAEPPC